VVLLDLGVVSIALLALWVFCIFDVIATDDALVRNLPKGMWLLIVIFLPDIGSLAWLLLGRPMYAGWRPGDTTRRPPRRVIGPEDRHDFPSGSSRPAPPAPRPLESRENELAAWEEQLRRREEELRRREQGQDDPPDAPAS
jgi:Phospholipase_D-nuclease N-terminal